MSKKKATAKQQTKAKSAKFPLKLWQTLCLLTALSFIFYTPILQNDFINFDDPLFIAENSAVIHSNWPVAFKWNFYTPHFKPIVFFSWMLESKLFGMSPKVFHFNNLLLHLFNVLMVFLIVMKLGMHWLKDQKSAWYLALFTALLFGIHPLRVESIAWATERKDVLFAAFYLSGIWAYLKYTTKKSWPWIALAALCYVLSIMSKSMGITMIAILFLIDYGVKRKPEIKLLLEKIPFLLVLTGGFYVFGMIPFLEAPVNMEITKVVSELHAAPVEKMSGAVSFYNSFLIANYKLWFWLAHSIIPVKLSLIYPGDRFLNALGPAIYALPVMSVGLAFSLLFFRAKIPVIFFGVAFFVIAISPALAVHNNGVGVFASDRYTYIPGIGFGLVVAYLMHLLKNRFSLSDKIHQIAITGIVALMGIGVFNTCKIWYNSETLWLNVINQYPQIVLPYINISNYYTESGQFEKALQFANAGLKTGTSDVRLLNNKAYALMKANRHDQAVPILDEAIRINDQNLDLFFNRGICHDKLANYEKAIQDYSRTLEMKPKHKSALLKRGNIYLMKRRDYNNSIKDFQSVLKFYPKHIGALINLAISYFDSQDYENSLATIERAIKTAPSNGQLYFMRAMNYDVRSQYPQAYADGMKAKNLGFPVPDEQLLKWKQ